MKHHRTPLLENRSLGHIVAVIAFLLFGYWLYHEASTKINYNWQWSKIPSYIIDTETRQITAPCSGTIEIQGSSVQIRSENDGAIGAADCSVSAGKYDLKAAQGDFVNEGDEIASREVYVKGRFIDGLIVTLKISLLAIFIAFSIGVIMSLAKLSRYQFLKDIATVYVNVIRGTPLLVQMLLFYFIIASIFKIDGFYAGAISLGIFYGAYIAEVLRGAIQSIDKGQHEAAISLGMNVFQTMQLIIIPQALKRALPTLINEVISLVKDSSLVMVVGITDLTKVGREIVAQSFNAFETYITIACIYLLVTATLSVIGNRIEARMKKQGGY